MVGWALLADTVPLYPLYALLFADSGLSGAEISALFAIWSAVGLLAEVPSGALADRFSRRGCLVAAGCPAGRGLRGMGAAADLRRLRARVRAVGPRWCARLRRAGGAALRRAGRRRCRGQYARVNGWVNAAELLAQLPAAVAATVLYAGGGYPLVGWVSVGTAWPRP